MIFNVSIYSQLYLFINLIKNPGVNKYLINYIIVYDTLNLFPCTNCILSKKK